MKRMLSAVLIAAFLAGCSATPVITNDNTVAPTPSASHTVVSASPIETSSAASSPVATLTPTTTPIPTPSPSPTVTPLASSAPTPTAAGENLPFPKLDATNRSQISSVAVAYGNFVYYRRDEYAGTAVFSRIIAFDKKTQTEKELLSTKGSGCISELLIGNDGTLYYLVSADNLTDTNRVLYRYRQGKSVPMAKDVCLLLYADKEHVYYNKAWDESYSPSDFAALSLKTGAEKSIAGNCRMADFLRYGGQTIDQKSNGASTEFSMTDIAANSSAKLQVKAALPNVIITFIDGNRLIAVDYDEAAQQSKIYRIDVSTGKILSVLPVNGQIEDYERYDGKVYFFSSREDENETVVDQKISAYDPATGKHSAFAAFALLDDHLSWPVLVEAGGYLWCCREWEGDGVFLDYVRKMKLK